MRQCQQLYSARIAELQKRSLDREYNAADGPDLDRCAAREADAADKELADLIGTMRAHFIYPDNELAAQKAWEEYRDKECESRAALNGTWGSIQTQQCRVDFDKSRIKEGGDSRAVLPAQITDRSYGAAWPMRRLREQSEAR